MIDKNSIEDLLHKNRELQRENELLANLVENSPDLFYRTDLEGRITYISPSVFGLSGFTVDEAVGMKMAEEVYLYPEERNRFLALLQKSGKVKNFEARLKRKDGSVWWASTNAHFFRDRDGNIAGVEGITRDISELKESEYTLREMEERFRTTFHTIPDSITLSRSDNGIYIDINQGFTELSGYTRDEVIGKSSFEVNIWKDTEDRKKLIEGVMKEGYVKNHETRFVRKNGEIGVGLISARNLIINGEEILLSVVRDITDLRMVDEALRRTEELNRMFVRQAGAVFWSVDKELKFTISSGAGLSKIGLSEGQAVGLDLRSFLGAADDTHPAIEAVNKALNGESVTYFDHFGGVDWEGRVEPLRDSSGRIIGAVGISLDITDRLQAEKALRESEERLRLITENMADVITLTDPDVNIVYSSPSVERVFGYPTEVTIGKPARERIHPDDLDHTLKQAAEARQKKEKSLLLKYRWQHANGEYIWAESATRLLYGEQGESKGAIFSTRDITERIQAEEDKKALEKQLIQVQKMEAIGRLAGGIAHDLNNLLSPILGYSDLLLGMKDMSPKVRARIELISKAGIGARDLVRQLLAFSRRQALEYKTLNLNHVLSDFETLLRRTIREDIEIKIVRSPRIGEILADAGQLEQVIMNLALNAAEAMPEGGKLTIETLPVELDEEYTKNNPSVAPGHYVMLAFTDTGHGMDKETASRIFEPFFTTKGKKGTGLGLATVYGIVKQHQGNIWVYSEPEQGTTIKVYLPVSDEVRMGNVSEETISDDLAGVETILLVEDNMQVLNIVQEILIHYGYNVLVADNAVEAREIMSNIGIDIQLLLTDVVMPDVNGKELYLMLAETHPDLKVLYMSGYTDNVIVHHGVLDEGVHFIQKPFTVANLVGKVRALLDQ